MSYCVVFGCCTLDKTIYEKDNSKKISFGGKGGNQAVALSRAGVNTYMLTKLSSLNEEKKITKAHLKNLKKNKVNTKFIDFDKYKNDVTNVIVAKNGDNALHEVKEISNYIDVAYARKYKQLIENAEFVILQLKVPIETTKEIISICKKSNTKTVLTPCRPEKAVQNPEIIEGVDFITCNEKEFYSIFGNNKKLSEKEIHNILKKYPNKLIVTFGNKGVMFYDGKNVITEKSLYVENVIDTTGAGDTFCSNFVSCLLEGKQILEAVRKGICASTIKIQIHGTQDGMPKKQKRDKFYKVTYKKGEINL